MSRVFAIPDKSMIEQRRLNNLLAVICSAQDLRLEVPVENWVTKGRFHRSTPHQFIYAKPIGRIH